MCEDEVVAADTLGRPVAERLRARLADIRAAESVADLVVGADLLDDPPTLTLGLPSGYKVVCRPNDQAIPTHHDGTVAWDRVRRLQVVEIFEESPS